MLVKLQKEYAIVRENNSKIPASNWSIPASVCKTGGKLRQVNNSPCASCYALKFENMYPSVSKGWNDNLSKFLEAEKNNDLENWIKSVALQILKAAKKNNSNYHRWFVGGDIYSIMMLDCIKAVASITPGINHWLPTQERAFVKASKYETPGNLVIRISASMIDGKRPNFTNTSTVNKIKGTFQGQECNAYKQDGSCGDCRACWNSEVENISYPLH